MIPTLLVQELEGVRESESSLRVECSREKISSAQLRDTLTRERSLTQQLSAQVEHLTGQLASTDHTQATVNQLQVVCSIVVVVPDTGCTRCMVECPQCLGLQLFCILLPSGLIAPPPDTTTPLMARYLLIKIWLPGNRIHVHLCNNWSACNTIQQ